MFEDALGDSLVPVVYMCGASALKMPWAYALKMPLAYVLKMPSFACAGLLL